MRRFAPRRPSDELNNEDFSRGISKKDVVTHLSPDEPLLFEVKSHGQERINRLIKYIIICAFGFFIVYLPFYILFLGKFSSISLVGLIFPLVVGFFFLLFGKQFLKFEVTLFITNRKLYFDTKQLRFSFVKEIALSDIKAIDFKNDSLKKKSGVDTGSISFITCDSLIEEYQFNYVHDFTHCKKTIESIFYEYGPIKERWDSLKNKPDFQFPLKLQISSNGIVFISKRNRLTSIYLLLTVLITFGVGYAFFRYVAPLFPYLQIILEGFSVAFPVLFGAVIIRWYIMEKHQIRQRTALIDANSKLTVYDHEFIFTGKIEQVKIPFTEKIILNCIKIRKPLDQPRKWEIYDGLQIDSVVNKIIFGPIENGWEIFQLLFYYSIIWKAEQGLLLSKESIGTKIPPDLGAPDPLDSTLDAFQKYLEPDEKILLAFQPPFNIKKSTQYSIIGLTGMIISYTFFGLGIMEVFPDFISNWDALIFGFLAGMLFLIVFVYGVVTLIGDFIRRRQTYVFSDQRLFIKYKDNIEPVKFEKIISITPKYRYTSDTYEINLQFKSPIDISKLISLTGYDLTLSRIPNMNNLYDRIKPLIEKAKK